MQAIIPVILNKRRHPKVESAGQESGTTSNKVTNDEVKYHEFAGRRYLSSNEVTMARGGHSYKACRTTCDWDQNEIKGSTLVFRIFSYKVSC